ncbi:MAG: myo-inositol-1-phosphate synthase [Candidatus Lokiarchaeota archaeon]|nr:myo-inositol-1-phosphate synthase [Candidatus Lokiarchaeota archaeon]
MVKRSDRRKKMMNINIAIIGVGNAASAFIQGIYYYSNGMDKDGLTYKTLAGYRVSDVKVVAAIDISKDKIGKDLSEAIFSGSNEAAKIIDVPNLGVKVEMGKPLDGVFEETEKLYQTSSEPCTDIVNLLKTTETELVLCLLPSSADKAVKFYAERAIEAGVGFINATPTKLATDKDWVAKFENAGVPLVGDDLQDQIGSTILHKLILQEMEHRGVKIVESYALDVGGGPESLNTIYRARGLKRDIKSQSIKSALKNDAEIVAGTSDYVPHLGNSRNTLLWIVGKHFNGQKIVIDMKIQSVDGANGGAILMDIVRACKVALIREEKGAIMPISAYGFKNPPGGTKNPDEAKTLLADFILGHI